MATVTFDELMKGFGVVTVMNACIFVSKVSYTGNRNCGTPVMTSGGGMTHENFEPAYEYIETLKIANFTPEGPTKSVTGGQYANTLIKYGKTMTAEIQDALGRASTMVRFFGCDYNGKVYKRGVAQKSEYCMGDGATTEYLVFPGVFPTQEAFNAEKANIALKDIETITATYSYDAATKGVKATMSAEPTDGDVFYFTLTPAADIVTPGTRLSVTDKFPGAFAIEGDTFFIDQKTGEKKQVYIFIPQFYPDAIFTLTQDAEGDATVFDLNGTVAVTDISDEDGTRSIFYEIREKSFFEEERKQIAGIA